MTNVPHVIIKLEGEEAAAFSADLNREIARLKALNANLAAERDRLLAMKKKRTKGRKQ